MNIRHDPCKACHTGTSSINKEQLRGHDTRKGRK